MERGQIADDENEGSTKQGKINCKNIEINELRTSRGGVTNGKSFACARQEFSTPVFVIVLCTVLCVSQGFCLEVKKLLNSIP